jgi:hypothetical protein
MMQATTARLVYPVRRGRCSAVEYMARKTEMTLSRGLKVEKVERNNTPDEPSCCV